MKNLGFLAVLIGICISTEQLAQAKEAQSFVGAKDISTKEQAKNAMKAICNQHSKMNTKDPNVTAACKAMGCKYDPESPDSC